MLAGLVRACHDLSEGGLAVTAAEMVIAGNLGLDLHLDAVAADTLTALFSETPSRFLVEVHPDDAGAFEAALDGVALTRLGTVTVAPTLLISAGGTTVLALDAATLRARWKSALDGMDL
jgi:phosphoribosylformylglycinamidine synthase